MYRTQIGKLGFTLIELMIVITIMIIISMATYVPYAHHQKKVLVQQGAREISQSLSDARGLAINGLNTGSGNVNTALKLTPGDTSLEYHVYPHDIPYDPTIGFPSDSLLRKKKLPAGVQIDSIDGHTDKPYIFTFSSISGTGAISPSVSGSPIDIQISYQGATSPVLQKVIKYYPQSYISDY